MWRGAGVWRAFFDWPLLPTLMNNDSRLPDALLLLTSTCPHCPTVLSALGDLVKRGAIGRLEVINIEAHPEAAQRHNVRSVPWFRIGDLEFEGAHTPAELRQWAERAGTPEGLAEYFHEQLKSGELARVSARVERDPSALGPLLQLLGDTDTELTARIGINAVFEGLEGSPLLKQTVEPLSRMLSHRDAHIRGDAAHLLSLSHDPRARAKLTALLHDEVADIREIAREGLERLATS
jgi:thiol-disulfide isomerase/thioredoxin